MKFKLLLISALFALSCTTVQKIYMLPDYGKNQSGMIKRIHIFAENETTDESRLRAFSLISSDMIKSNSNYIIQRSGISDKKIKGYCSGSEGAVIFTLMKNDSNSSRKIRIKAELFKCPEKKLIWAAAAESDMAVLGDKKLENMSLMYEEKLNRIDGKAGSYAPAMFSALYDIIKTIPNPSLTEDEVNEKIDIETSEPESTFFDYFLNLPARTSS